MNLTRRFAVRRSLLAAATAMTWFCAGCTALSPTPSLDTQSSASSQAGSASTFASASASVSASASPSPSPSASASAAPAEVAVGPDGTHYPSDTPDLRGDTSGYHVVDVPARSTAIRSALDRLTAAQIDQGTIIRVEPGDIPDMTALDHYSNARKTKVLITARDGFGTVTGSNGWLFTDVQGISVMRFDLLKIDVKGARHCSFGWLRLTGNYFGAAGLDGVPVRDVEFIEVVEPHSVVKSSDSAQLKAYAPESLSDVLVEGAYVAPSFYRDGAYGGSGAPRPHTDSLQIEGDGINGPVVIRDTVIFGSNNSAVIVGRVPDISFEHTLVVAGGVQQLRYPFLAGGAGARGARQDSGPVSAIQGTGGGGITAADSTFIGSTQPKWARVTDTTTNLEGRTADAGTFTVAPELTDLTQKQLDAMSPVPTAAYLRRIWD